MGCTEKPPRELLDELGVSNRLRYQEYCKYAESLPEDLHPRLFKDWEEQDRMLAADSDGEGEPNYRVPYLSVQHALGVAAGEAARDTLAAMSERPDTYDEENVFTYHKPGPLDPAKYTAIREQAKGLALLLRELCPNGPELAKARRKIEEAVFWANASIARQSEPE